MHERHAVELEQVKQLLREVLQGTQVPFTSYSVLGQLKQTPEVIGELFTHNMQKVLLMHVIQLTPQGRATTVLFIV